ncbi:dihydrofolate reductase family protein [Actinoallomurus iriomotensis]|uniref:Pyrimidine reductase n=1 Tax=Actinoallomurus iriomotensis TaxID=478107 RepID=A0A9W6S421_9ACTN|nr:dihydrofolate reductase family protein [Actinoallomurus iriomotensis]GLY86699.1 pyrimidine reductase [Actinoallomurus iriomotensis]
MGKIVISETASLDGLIGGSRFADWFDRMGGKDREAWAGVEFKEALDSEALLLGRRTYEWFVARGWTSRSGEWADRLRSLPKYVVSSSLEDLDWNNSTVLKSDVVNTISKLKQNVNGDIVVYGSGRLVHTLMEHDLIDELRLMICPTVIGDGERLFGKTSHQKPMRLVDTRTVGDGLVRLAYQSVRDA